jgi:hypothetical protein
MIVYFLFMWHCTRKFQLIVPLFHVWFSKSANLLISVNAMQLCCAEQVDIKTRLSSVVLSSHSQTFSKQRAMTRSVDKTFIRSSRQWCWRCTGCWRALTRTWRCVCVWFYGIIVELMQNTSKADSWGACARVYVEPKINYNFIRL